MDSRGLGNPFVNSVSWRNCGCPLRYVSCQRPQRLSPGYGTTFVSSELWYYHTIKLDIGLVRSQNEAVATACYTQNCSIVRLHHGKTPYELLHDKPPDLSFFHVFGALCYPTNDSENFVVDDIITLPPSIDYPASEFVAQIHKVVAPVPAVSIGSPSSTNVDQDAPSPKIPSDQSLSSDSIHTIRYKDALDSNPTGSKQCKSVHSLNTLKMELVTSTRQSYGYYFEVDLQSEARRTGRQFCGSDNPNHVYKLKKALYGLKQAPRVWYDILSSFLISQDFSKGSVDPTLFICKEGKELLPVQVYVDDNIFAASTHELCDLFAKIMCLKFKMLMMGKISFFLGLQNFQNLRGIFINQSKYALESLKKYDFDSCDPQ
ncbi:retrovirus-related pol polyprotein from transposon TNT 1-94 [Tanacetum coccineum]